MEMNQTASIKSKSFLERPRVRAFRKLCYKYSRNALSVIGLAIVLLILFLTIFSDLIIPYPDDCGLATHLSEMLQAPSKAHLFGTDEYGRDIFSRSLVGLRYSVLTSVIVLCIAVPFGTSLGLLAGYYRNTWVEMVIIRFTDLFMSIPTLVTAMVICTLGSGGWLLGTLAIAASWWAWYCRLTYNSVRSVSNELFVTYAELSGQRVWRVIFSEVLPNIVSPILTKASLDFGTIIITSSSMSFLGLGIQPPTPSLGSMVSSGVSYLPNEWWVCLFPAMIVVLIVMGFNLLGDGLGDALAVEDK